VGAFSYLDSSAILKLVIHEPESDAVETYMIGREALLSSRLCEVEVLRAVRRAADSNTMQRVDQQLREALDALFLRDVDANVLHRAGLVEPRELESLDAIHLATALTLGDPEIEFVTYDGRLAKAAEAAGLRVVQPGHPPAKPVGDQLTHKER